MPEPFLHGRPTWLIDGEPEPPPLTSWLFWIFIGCVVGAVAGVVLWRIVR